MREIVGAGRQWEDFWIIGTWDPLGCGQNGWEMKTSVSRLPDSPGNDPEIRQTISNTAKLLSCFTPFGRFWPNILFCQQLWTHNSANPPKVGHGNVEVEGICGRFFFLRDAQHFPESFSPLIGLLFLTLVATVACLSLQYPPLDYPWLAAALRLVIKPPLWLALMCRTPLLGKCGERDSLWPTNSNPQLWTYIAVWLCVIPPQLRPLDTVRLDRLKLKKRN